MAADICCLDSAMAGGIGDISLSLTRYSSLPVVRWEPISTLTCNQQGPSPSDYSYRAWDVVCSLSCHACQHVPGGYKKVTRELSALASSLLPLSEFAIDHRFHWNHNPHPGVHQLSNSPHRHHVYILLPMSNRVPARPRSRQVTAAALL